MPASPRASHVTLAALVAFAPLAALVACGASPALTPRPAPAPTAAIPPSPPASSATSPDPHADLAARVDALFTPLVGPDGSGPGCAVGVYRAGDVVFSRGYGSADVEHGAPMTDDTPVYTASLSKQFTAAAVLLLAADGKLALDDDVHEYIPELGDFGGQRITIDHLLHHTSGLRDYHLLLLLAGLDEEDVITRREVLWLIAHQLGAAIEARIVSKAIDERSCVSSCRTTARERSRSCDTAGEEGARYDAPPSGV